MCESRQQCPFFFGWLAESPIYIPQGGIGCIESVRAVTTNRSNNDIANNCIKVGLFKERATNRQMLAAIFPPQRTVVYRCRDIVVTMSPFKIKFR